MQDAERVELPLSRPQLRLLRTDEMYQGYPVGTLLFTYVLPEQTSFELIELAWQAVVEKHDALRARLKRTNAGVVQWFAQPGSPELDAVAACCSRMSFRGKALSAQQEWFEAEAQRRIELFGGPLYRFTPLQYADGRTGFALAVHHIISDFMSLLLVSRYMLLELAQLRAGGTTERAEVPSYAEFVKSEAEYLSSKRLDADRAFWLSTVDGVAEPLNITRREAGARSCHALRHKFSFTRDTTAGIRQLASTLGVSTYVVLLSSFTAYLARLVDRESFVLGSVVHGRNNRREKATLGMFVSTLPVVAQVRAAEPFAAHCERTARWLTRAYRHQRYPFDMLAQDLRERGQDLGKLVDVVFSYEGGAFELENEWHFCQHEYFPLVLHITEREGEDALRVELDYRATQWRSFELQGFLRGFLAFVDAAMAAPDRAIAELELVPRWEAARLSEHLNATARPYARDALLHELIADQIARRPHQRAVSCGALELNYAELGQRAAGVSAWISGRDAGQRRCVALIADRSPAMLVAILGILQAGCAYVPIDPTYPAKRVAHMLNDVGARLLVLASASFDTGVLASGVPSEGELDVLSLPPDGTAEFGTVELRTIRAAVPNTTACVLYTSGTTGVPKGNPITHRSLVRLVQAQSYLQVSPDDRILQFSNYVFDGSLFDIFAALTNGAQLVLADQETFLNIGRLGGLLSQHGVNVLLLPTAMFNAVVDLDVACLRGLRALMFGGERASTRHVEIARAALVNCQLIHCYGPSENGVYTTTYEVGHAPQPSAELPIGKPIANTRTYVVDARGRLLPAGCVGELRVGGDGLTSGYVNQPELSATRFVPDPFRAGELVYKTGDLVVMTPAGDLIFVGREDRQVKRRGFRVELDGIEAHLRQHALVQQAVVALDDGVGAQRSIRAFYVAAGPLDAAALRAHLLNELPHYALPDHLTQVDAMPLTVNGKVDVAALLARAAATSAADGRAPSTETERRVAAIWQQVLSERPAAQQSFFELGGNSIKLLEVHARLQQEFPGAAEVGDLFAYTTVEALAHFLDRRRAKDTPSPHARLLDVPEHWRPNGSASGEAAVQLALKGDRLRRLGSVSSARGVSKTEFAARAFVASVRLLLQASSSAGSSSQHVNLPCVLRMNGDAGLRWTQLEIDGQREWEALARRFTTLDPATPADDVRFDLDDLRAWRRSQPQAILPVFESTSLQPELKARDAGLVMRVRQAPSSLSIRCEYDAARLTRACVEQLLSYWVNALDSWLGPPAAPEHNAEV